MPKSGIYQIRNLVTGARYIGQSTHLGRRFRREKSDLLYGRHSNTHLQRSWNKHGSEAFAFEPFAIIEPDLLTHFEQRAFDVLNTRHGCYNQGPFTDSPMRGKKLMFSAQHRRNIGLTSKGRRHSAETRNKISQSNIGRRIGYTHSEETRRKIAAARHGRSYGPLSEVHRSKLKKMASLRHRDPSTGRFVLE